MDLGDLLQSPRVMILLAMALVIAGLAAMVHTIISHEDEYGPAPRASDDPDPELAPEVVERIVREARRAARLDHALALYTDRRSPFPRYSRANALWADAYAQLRAELERAERDQLMRSFSREV